MKKNNNRRSKTEEMQKNKTDQISKTKEMQKKINFLRTEPQIELYWAAKRPIPAMLRLKTPGPSSCCLKSAVWPGKYSLQNADQFTNNILNNQVCYGDKLRILCPLGFVCSRLLRLALFKNAFTHPKLSSSDSTGYYLRLWMLPMTCRKLVRYISVGYWILTFIPLHSRPTWSRCLGKVEQSSQWCSNIAHCLSNCTIWSNPNRERLETSP